MLCVSTVLVAVMVDTGSKDVGIIDFNRSSVDRLKY